MRAGDPQDVPARGGGGGAPAHGEQRAYRQDHADGGALILNAVETGEGTPVVLLHGLFGMARNLGVVQRRLAPRFRVIALDLRNHGASPHGAAMSYPAMAADVQETLAARGALPAAFVGHSMGGKVAMRLALERPSDVRRLLVADIAPVRYPSHFGAMVQALQALPLRPGTTRADADATLSEAVPEPSVRAFLLQNLRFEATPSWRIGLDAIAAALPAIEDWPETGGRIYDGPALFVAGARSDYVQADARPAIRALFPAARFVTLKDAGHWLHADNPDGFGAIVEAFVSG